MTDQNREKIVQFGLRVERDVVIYTESDFVILFYFDS